jgi:hypothetical protein
VLRSSLWGSCFFLQITMPEKTGTGIAKSSPLATARLNFETNSVLER